MTDHKYYSKTDTNQSKLIFGVFKDYHLGKINAKQFINQCERDAGVVASPELRSLLRRKEYNANFYEVQKQFRGANISKEPATAVIRTCDGTHQLYKRNNASRSGVEPLSLNQRKIEGAISDYADQKIDKNEFMKQLTAVNVPIDTQLETMIRRHESNDFVSKNTFRVKIFREINGRDTYNRVDKAQYNNKDTSRHQNCGKSWGVVNGIVETPSEEKADVKHIVESARFVGNTYVPLRQQGQFKSQNDKLKSKLVEHLNQEVAAATGANDEWVASLKNKRDLKDKYSFTNIVTWSGSEESANSTRGPQQRARHSCQTHAAKQNNGDFLKWAGETN